MKKYRTGGEWNNEIVEVDVVRETDKTVWRHSGLKERKIADYQVYHDTWRAAKDFLLARATQKKEDARMKLIDAEDTLHEIVIMEPPAAMERLTGEPA